MTTRAKYTHDDACDVSTSIPCTCEWPFPLEKSEQICSMCRGEGAVGTGYSDSFIDTSDAMPCPKCEGSGVVSLDEESP